MCGQVPDMQEIGACDPLLFWDPVGVLAAKNPNGFFSV